MTRCFNQSLRDIFRKEHLVTNHFLDSFIHLSDFDLFNEVQRLHVLSEADLHELLAKYGLQQVCLESLTIDPSLLSMSIFLDCQSLGCIPVYVSHKELTVALSNPYIELPTSLYLEFDHVVPLLISKHDFNSFLEKDKKEVSLSDLVEESIKNRASDIHCFFQALDRLDIYIRVHGALQYLRSYKAQEAIQFIQYIKLASHVDVGIHKHPQDGQCSMVLDNKRIDMRVSTLPTVYGEDVVLRLLHQHNRFMTWDDLDVHLRVQDHLNHISKQQSGLFLVTGPTGSGKTTTLYMLLRQLQQLRQAVIVTLEDPVEQVLEGIRQSSIQPEKGYTYAKGLKAVLRQDPDIIMIGEIRDHETAQIALEAAYTGHLVLSTLHTHDIFASLLRLKSLKIDPFLMAYCLRGIISQKLIPVTCSCEPLKKNQCHHCNGTGIQSRKLDQESLLITSEGKTDALFDPNQWQDIGDYICFSRDNTK